MALMSQARKAQGKQTNQPHGYELKLDKKDPELQKYRDLNLNPSPRMSHLHIKTNHTVTTGKCGSNKILLVREDET